jgi:hypothetical protein
MKYFLGFIFLILLACASRQVETVQVQSIPVNVYNLNNGEILRGEFYWTGLKGKAALINTNGERCEGEYLTQMGGYSGSGFSSSWGHIYSWGLGTGGAFTNTNTSVNIHPRTNVGSAILVCADKNIIECEYIVNRDIHGSGFCKDKAGTKYKFVF